MGKMQVKVPDAFLKRLSGLAERTDEIVGECLKAGGKVVADAVRSNLAGSIGGTKYPSRSTTLEK
jgi:hypothetical protein